MASDPASPPLPEEIRHLLARVRRRIRTYVWLQGLSLAVTWLGLTFWLGLALDYLPVLAGVGEMPRGARAGLLVTIAGVLGWILYRWVLRRVFVRLADRSMAVLVEKYHRQLGESLITAVELADRPGDSNPTRQMLTETRESALRQLKSVQLAPIFNTRPLALSLTGASVLVISILGFYLVNSRAWALGVGRLYFLKNDTWPRHAQIEVVGIAIREQGETEGSGTLVSFNQQRLKVARGGSLALLVRADASREVVPEFCVIHYQTADGDEGRVNMTRIGRVRDGFQHYRYEGKPFDGILSDLTFDVVGFDHRVSDYQLQVVDSPAIIDVQVDCVFPPYMVDEQLSSWLPRTVAVTPGMQLPQGTKLRIRARANKRLTHVDWKNPDQDESGQITLPQPSEELIHEVAQLGEHLTLDLSLTDTDQVRSEHPYRLHISGIEDVPPTVDIRLRGIGASVTPNVIVPLAGKVTDDYGLAKTWLEVTLGEEAPREFSIQPAKTGETTYALDFRSERGKPEGITLAPGGKLQLTVRALDRRDLGAGPNAGAGDHYQLEVVTPEQLLTQLEARELGLRRRFEQVLTEMTETRDMLVRVRVEGPATAAAPSPSPAESPAGAEDATERLKRIWALRLLRSRQSLLQSQKSAQEVLGIAAAFHDIYEELINNRVDTEDRKQRLEGQIAVPLKAIGETQFAEFDQTLEKLSAELAKVESSGKLTDEDPASLAAAQAAIDQANRILRDLDAILQRMLDLESFNELLDIVRELIEEQERVSTETKKEQKKAVLDLLK